MLTSSMRSYISHVPSLMTTTNKGLRVGAEKPRTPYEYMLVLRGYAVLRSLTQKVGGSALQISTSGLSVLYASSLNLHDLAGKRDQIAVFDSF